MACRPLAHLARLWCDSLIVSAPNVGQMAIFLAELDFEHWHPAAAMFDRCNRFHWEEVAAILLEPLEPLQTEQSRQKGL
jgi:hypothetical protein